MANTFKASTSAVNSTPGTIVYTAPNGTSQVIHTLMVSNTSTLPQNVTVQFIDQSAGTTLRVLTGAPVPVGGTIFFPKPINLEAGDAVRVTGSNAGTLEAYVGVLEIT